MDQPPNQPPTPPPAPGPGTPPPSPGGYPPSPGGVPPSGGYPPPGGYPPGGSYTPGPGGYPPSPGVFGPTPTGRPLAEWWKRLVALIIDGLIIAVPGWILMTSLGVGIASRGDVRVDPATGELSGVAAGGFYAALFGTALLFAILSVAYYVYFHGSEKGQTVGKMAMKIQVRDEETGGAIGYGRAFARWLIPGLGGVMCGLVPIVDGLWPLWDSKRQALHDKVAKSVVVDAG